MMFLCGSLVHLCSMTLVTDDSLVHVCVLKCEG